MRLSQITPILLITTLAGCSWFGNKSTAPLIADARSPVSDVPVPAGFSMKENSSSQVVPGDLRRTVDHHYKGNDDILPVVSFYKDELPKHGWTWVDQTQLTGKEIVLHFNKKNEDCLVNVRKATFNTEIRLRLGPAGKVGNP